MLSLVFTGKINIVIVCSLKTSWNSFSSCVGEFDG